MTRKTTLQTILKPNRRSVKGRYIFWWDGNTK